MDIYLGWLLLGITWIVIGAMAAYGGYRAGVNATIKNLALLEELAEFHNIRREGFLDTLKEFRELFPDAEVMVDLQGERISVDSYLAGTNPGALGDPTVLLYENAPIPGSLPNYLRRGRLRGTQAAKR